MQGGVSDRPLWEPKGVRPGLPALTCSDVLRKGSSNIDSVLMSRFKRHRWSWSASGANRLGHLVALRHNGRLSEWLKQESCRDKQTDSQKRGLSEKRYRWYAGDDTAAWLRKGLPLLGTNTTPLVMAVRGLSQLGGLTRPSSA